MDLPDELLLMILKHLDNTEMLHSLMCVHMRLDQIISDPIFTTCLTLMRFSIDNVIYIDCFECGGGLKIRQKV